MEVAEDELMMIVWEGWLKKKTPRGLVKVWQNRYFRLLGDILEYYKSDKLGVCSGMIPLQMMTGLHIHPSNKKDGCRFDILLAVGHERRVFSLLAPTAEVCEKLVRSIRNMLHHPVDESARMDISNIDISGNFWKKIDEIDRRRAGSSKKVDVAAQFAGFDIKPRARKKKPVALTTIGPDGSVVENKVGPDGSPRTPGGGDPTPNRFERERIQADAKAEEVETPAIRVLKELRSLPIGKLYLARDNESKVPYYMHVVNRSIDATDPADPHTKQIEELWNDMVQLNHPLMIKYVTNGESKDRKWLLYEYPHHASLEFHVSSILKQQHDRFAYEVLIDLAEQAPPFPTQVLPISVIEYLGSELLMTLDFLHQREIVAINLDLAHLYLTDQGHLTLLDFFLLENKEGDTKRREAKGPRCATPEFVRREPEDFRSDYWRFGLVLYRLLTGLIPPGFSRPKDTNNEEDEMKSLAYERKMDSEHGSSELSEEERIKSNILSFNPFDEYHLPFPANTTEDLIDLIRCCFQPASIRVLAGKQASIVGGVFAATSAAQANVNLQDHPFFQRIDWRRRKEEVHAAQVGSTPLLPAPNFIFDSLLYASHNFAFTSSTVLAHIKQEYKIHVIVKSGRNFRREILQSTVVHHASPTSPTPPIDAASSIPQSPTAAAASVATSGSATKFYIKVLVDGKALKTDIYDSATNPVSMDEWNWNKRMQFKADDASLETDLIARVMAHDEESFHDATIGMVSIPLRHVYQVCSSLDRTAKLESGNVASEESTDGCFDAWFSVIDRDGFVVGELRLNFQLTHESKAHESQAVAPVVSRRRFSGLFGSDFSGDHDKEELAAQPKEASLIEIQQPQLIIPEPSQTDDTIIEEEREDELEDELTPKQSVPIARRISQTLSSPTLKSSPGATVRASMAHLDTLMKSHPIDDADDEDEDEEEEKLTHTSLGPITPTMSGPTHPPDRRSSQSMRRSIIGTGTSLLPPGASAPQTGGAVGFLRGLVSKKKVRFQQAGFDLDLSYIGDRIIAMGFPSEGSEAAYRNPMPQVQLFFKTFHPGAYKVYNLCSERKYDHAKFEQCENGQVAEYPFDDHNAPEFHHILDFCVDVHAFLGADPENVAAIHCKAGKGRTGLMIACYLLYSGICSHPDAALIYFATHRTSNVKGVTIPSQIRYVHYFHRYLTEYFDINRPFNFSGTPLLLTHIRLSGIPKFDLVSGGSDPYFTIFEGTRCVYDFQRFKLTQGGGNSRMGSNGGLISNTNSNLGTTVETADSDRDVFDHIDFKVFTTIKGDCKFLLYERDRLGRSQKVAWFWLNTSFIPPSAPTTPNSSYLCLTKKEIDGAIKDKEDKHFPAHFKCELFFQNPTIHTTNEYGEPLTNSSGSKKESFTRLADRQLRMNHEQNADPLEPFISPFDMPFINATNAVCEQQTSEQYDLFQAEEIEAAQLFQPEAPPS